MCMRPNAKMDENRSRVGNRAPSSSPTPMERRNPASVRSNGSPQSDRGRTVRNTKTKQLLSKKPGRSKLPHDAPMGRGHIYYALDCEMVGVGPAGTESALARVVIVNWHREVVLDTFVKPPVPVTDYRTFVSGVRPEDVESEWAMKLEDCRNEVASILKGKILIGHGLQNDLDAIGISHPWCDTRDTTTYAPFMRTCTVDDESVLRPRKLRDLAYEELGMLIQADSEAHCPIEDACAALDLYKSVRMEWERVIMNQVNAARESEQAKKPRRKPRRAAQPRAQPRNQPRNPRRRNSYHSPTPISPPRSLPRITAHHHQPPSHGYSHNSYDAGNSPLFPPPAMQHQYQYNCVGAWPTGWNSPYDAAPQAAQALKWNQRVQPIVPAHAIMHGR